MIHFNTNRHHNMQTDTHDVERFRETHAYQYKINIHMGAMGGKQFSRRSSGYGKALTQSSQFDDSFEHFVN